MKQKHLKLAMTILLIASCFTLYGAPTSIAITHPQDSAIVSGAVDITAAIDGRTKKRVTFFIDNVEVYVDKTSPYVFNWDTTLYSEGTHNLKVQVVDRNSRTLEHAITVTVRNNEPPFGEITTPADGVTVAGVIPFTGWALDDTEVTAVKMYRDSDQGLVYIWDASFVKGLRPDIAQEYPDYPNNERAAWAFSLMTGLFPDKGNSTYAIHAVAVDAHGVETTLGVRTIHCDNANSTEPFGSFFRPEHGETVSGNFMNTGWALTPQPNTIPYDGSTITAFVDGVAIGNTFYNIWREEIAHAFQGYNNSEGAGGYIYIDTTQYQNGLHTVNWTVVDDAGNSGTVGPRYFIIENPVSTAMQRKTAPAVNPAGPGPELNVTAPVGIRTGYNETSALETRYPGENGAVTVEIEEMERLVLRFFDNGIYTAHSLESGEPAALPAGSSVDKANGIFYWQPGPGAVGAFRMVFLTGQDAAVLKKYPVIITIKPKTK